MSALVHAPRGGLAGLLGVARFVALAALVVPALVLSGEARAAEVPGFEREVMLMAREQPIDQFLEELFGNVDVPVRVDPSVVGTVNGDFDKSAGEVFDDIRGAFQITLYFDGAVAYVYPSNATTRSVLYLSDGLGEQVMTSAERMGLTDGRNRLEMTDVGLVLTGVERFVEQVEELAEAVRRDAGIAPAVAAPAPSDAHSVAPPESSYRVFPLRYAWAEDTAVVVGGQEVVVPGVASLLRELVGPGGMRGMRAAPGSTRRQLERTLPGLRGEGLRSIGREREVRDDELDRAASEADGSGEGAGPYRSGDSGGGGGGIVRIVANALQNAVVIRDRPERMADYEELIAALDIEPSMIEIEATIIDLDTSRMRELGVNLRAEYADGDTQIGGEVDDGSALDAPVPSALGAATGGVVSLILGDETRFLSRIQALETQGAARVVSKPHVITLTNVEAVLETISTFFVRIAGREEVDLFDVSVGTTLRVTPHVFQANGRSRIKLLVSIDDGSTLDRAVDGIPIIKRSSINTQALIDGGQSLLIGGLVRELDGNTVSKVPLLGDIPGVGALFRSTERSSSRVERLFLISPRLSIGRAEGPRYSAPVLRGDESEIIATAPARARAASLGLARRDERYPLAESLPPGGAEVELIPSDYDAEAEAAAREEARAVSDRGVSSERSLRERLLGLPPDSRERPPAAEFEPERRAPPEEPRRWRVRENGDRVPEVVASEEGWIEIPGTAPDERSEPALPDGAASVAALVGDGDGSSPAREASDETAAPDAALDAEEAAWRADGWQEITR